MPNETPTTTEGENKYLTFLLGRGDFAIDLGRVREIIPLVDIVPVPLAPDHVRGVINLRGQIVPVVDLRSKLGLPKEEDHDRKCIIVCDAMVGSQLLPAGMLVDAVSEVTPIAKPDIEPPSLLEPHTDIRFLRGIAKVEGHVRLLLDVDALFGTGVFSIGELEKDAPA